MEKVIELDKFTPRDYQNCLFDALEEQEYKRILAIWPRRCLSGDSRILMADGSEKLLRKIKVGDKITSWNGCMFEDDVVVNVWKTGIKDTKIVKGHGLRPITTSADHRFAVMPSPTHNNRWVSADVLKTYHDILFHPYICDRKRKCWSGCYRTKATVADGDPELLFDMETKENHNFVANGYVVHNSGKDMCAWNLCIRELIKSVKTIYYVFPTFASGRRILWDAITNDGKRILDYLPRELVESRNEQLMRIRLTNGSVFQVIGSDSYDNTLVGTNPQGVVFSEFAISDPMAYSFVRPILTANNGWALIITTPRGRNFLYDMYQSATQHKDDWFVSKLTVDDTKHISLEEIEREISLGEMSPDLAQQEYWTSFSIGVEGGYYTKYVDRLRLQGQIGSVPWHPQYPVHTAWDIGVRDSTAIIFFQIVGQAIHVIDFYEKNKEGIEHYVELLRSKPYTYGSHIGPHDIRNFEFSSGTTRWEKARQLGVTFKVADRIGLMDGIEAVRTTLPRMWFDEKNCKDLIKAIENYRQEWDPKKKIYKTTPLHNRHSHACDAARYLAIYLPKLRVGMTPEDLKSLRESARRGKQQQFGRPFMRG